MVAAKKLGENAHDSFGLLTIASFFVIHIVRENPFLGAVLALYLLTWFLFLWASGWAVALAGSASYAAGQAWGMRSGRFHLSADAVALPLAILAVLVVHVLGGADVGTGYLARLVTAATALGMAYVAGHVIVALAAVFLDRVARKESGQADKKHLPD